MLGSVTQHLHDLETIPLSFQNLSVLIVKWENDLEKSCCQDQGRVWREKHLADNFLT